MIHRPLLLFSALLLTGCPYIFGPPDLSNVDRSLVGTDQTDDTVTPVPTGDSRVDTKHSDTGTEKPDPTPVITVEAVATATNIELRFAITDADGDLEKAILAWSDGTVAKTELPLKGGKGISWNELTYEGSLELDPVPADCSAASIDRTFAVQITDTAGNVSEAAEARLELLVLDTGSPTNPGQRQLGTITAPALLCGHLEEGDARDRWGTTHEPGGDWNIRFTHQGTPGVDLAVRSIAGTRTLSSGESPQLATGFDLSSGEAVAFEIDRRSSDYAPTAAYQVLIHH